MIVVFGHKSHGTVDFYCPLEMISVGDFTVLAEATGESVQDMTPLLFLFFFHTVNYDFCGIKTCIKATLKQAKCFTLSEIF